MNVNVISVFESSVLMMFSFMSFGLFIRFPVTEMFICMSLFCSKDVNVLHEYRAPSYTGNSTSWDETYIND